MEDEILARDAVILKPQLLDDRNRVLLEGVVDCWIEGGGDRWQDSGGFSESGVHNEIVENKQRCWSY